LLHAGRGDRLDPPHLRLGRHPRLCNLKPIARADFADRNMCRHGSTVFCPRQETLRDPPGRFNTSHRRNSQPIRATRDARIAPQWPSVCPLSDLRVEPYLTTACATPRISRRLVPNPTEEPQPMSVVVTEDH